MPHVSPIVGLSLIYIIEAAGLWWCASRNNYTMLRGFITLNMTLVVLFAPKMFELGGYQTNVAGAFHAASLVCIALLFSRHGKKIAYGTIFNLFSYMSAVYLLSGALALIEPAPASISISSSIDDIALYPITTLLGSLIATVFGIKTLVYLLDKMKAYKLSVIPALFVAQIVDSAVFYPISLHDYLINMSTVHLVATGLAFKLVFSFMLLPLYFYLAKRNRRH